MDLLANKHVFTINIIHYPANHCRNNDLRWFSDGMLVPLTNDTRIVSASAYLVVCVGEIGVVCDPMLQFSRPKVSVVNECIDLRCSFVQVSPNENLKLHVTHKATFNVSSWTWTRFKIFENLESSYWKNGMFHYKYIEYIFYNFSFDIGILATFF